MWELTPCFPNTANAVASYYSYDALDRLTAIAYAGGNASANVVNSYDGAPAGLANQLGRLTASQRGTLANQYSYDPQGNLASVSGWGLPHSVPNANTISYSYNAANQLTDINYSTYRDIHYAYDAAGQVNQITVQDIDANKAYSSNGYNLTRTLAGNITHLPFGPVNGLTYGNGLVLSKTYDLDYRLTGQSVGAIQNLSYSHDANGNLNTATDLLASANTQTFTYDALNRLLNATGPNSFTYTYDAVGNRTTDSKNNAETLYTYDAASQKLLTQTGARPDAILTGPTGNITQSEGKTYAYAPDQRLIAATQAAATLATYNYNPQGQRINKTTTTGTTGYDYNPQGQLLGETGPGLAASYVYLDGEPLARVDYNLTDTSGNVAAWNIAYYHNNPIGAPIKTSDRLGNVSWTGQLDPFGNVLPINPSITQNLRFPGQYYDAESGLIYNNQRWYDPWTGRYLQSDRIGLAGGINTYTYVGNNPLNLTDPNGLCSEGEAWKSNGQRGECVPEAEAGYLPGNAAEDFFENCPLPPIKGAAFAGILTNKVIKAIYLPAWKKIAIDMEDIASGHIAGGSRVSSLKTLFPENMSVDQVEAAIRDAYRYGNRVETQGDRVRIQGQGIEMWVNTSTKTIETAYPMK